MKDTEKNNGLEEKERMGRERGGGRLNKFF